MKKLYTVIMASICFAALAASSIQAEVEYRKQLAELEIRAASVATGVEEGVTGFLNEGQVDRLQGLLRRMTERQPIQAMILCVPEAGGIKALAWPVQAEWQALCSKTSRTESSWTTQLAQKKTSMNLQVNSSAIIRANGAQSTLLIVQDLSGAKRAWREAFSRTFFIVLFSVAAIAFLVASQIRIWLKGYALYLYRALRAMASGRRGIPRPDSFLNIPRDIDRMTAKILTLPVRHRAKAAQASTVPTEPPLLTALKQTLRGREVVVVANREPYIHRRREGVIEVQRPASGLVTALEPILRNCGGLWIGHGSGNADRETVNEQNEVRVPPAKPSYTLKRVWLTEEEEQGYYYGFSNEGLWPLCHLAHNRPTFRLSDWQNYVKVNQRFAQEIPERSLKSQSLILAQDYHFALLPRLIKERSADAKVSLFWHIPWPNPEAFGICPWNKELLHGMLGSDVIGFHTQYHCNNFLETCDRYLEARIDWERFSVTRGRHETLVRPFPIGIDTAPVRRIDDLERVVLKKRFGIHAEFVAVGVDRIDYTKGLLERVESVGRFLEKNPEYIGRFTLAQMGSSSRATIPAYRHLNEELESAVARINERFKGISSDPAYRPIVLIPHHSWDEIQYFYQIGDVCLVTSLHDGMNLVAKEYVWCQSPERGSLVLSKFTGASRELNEAFLVNPYSIEEMSDAIAAAIRMSPSEKAVRMNSMRNKVEKHNAFHWAADLVKALAQQVPTPSQAPGVFASGLRIGARGAKEVKTSHAWPFRRG